MIPGTTVSAQFKTNSSLCQIDTPLFASGTEFLFPQVILVLDTLNLHI